MYEKIKLYLSMKTIKHLLFFLFLLFSAALFSTENTQSWFNYSSLINGVQGQVEGHAVVVPFNSQSLRQILRNDYKLMNQKSTQEGTHPLLLLFFKFNDVRPSSPIFPIPPLGGPSYNSVYLLIPYSNLVSRPLPGNYSVMPRGFMNNHLMVASSRSFNGLPKEFAQISVDKDHFAVIQKQLPILSVNFSQEGGQLTGPSSFEIKKMIDMLTISDRPMNSGRYGTSGAQINWENVPLYPEKAHLILEKNLFPNLKKQDFFLKSYYFKTEFFIENFSPLVDSY